MSWLVFQQCAHITLYLDKPSNFPFKSNPICINFWQFFLLQIDTRLKLSFSSFTWWYQSRKTSKTTRETARFPKVLTFSKQEKLPHLSSLFCTFAQLQLKVSAMCLFFL